MLLNASAFLLCFLGVCNLHGFSLCSRHDILFIWKPENPIHKKNINLLHNNITYIILEKF